MSTEIIKHAKSDIEYVDGLEAHLDEGGATSVRNTLDLIAMVRWNAEHVVSAPDLARDNIAMRDALKAICACYPKNSNAHKIAAEALQAESVK